MRPQTLFYYKKSKVQVIEPVFFDQARLYDSLFGPWGIERNVYICPILIEEVNEKNFYIEDNHFKSDVFSLGMSMIHICMLESV